MELHEHDAEVPVPYEETGNLQFVQMNNDHDYQERGARATSTSSASSSSVPGGCSSIFQTVMQGYHGNSLFSALSSVDTVPVTNLSRETKGTLDGARFEKDINADTCDSTAVDDTECAQDRGEFKAMLSEFFSKPVSTYLSPKNADQPILTLDPYNTEVCIFAIQRITP